MPLPTPSHAPVRLVPTQREHEGRKLQWLYQHCKGELKTLYTKKTHFLEVRLAAPIAGPARDARACFFAWRAGRACSPRALGLFVHISATPSRWLPSCNSMRRRRRPRTR